MPPLSSPVPWIGRARMPFQPLLERGDANEGKSESALKNRGCGKVVVGL